MSERQVQYTDGSWSREVEVTDDAVEAATRLLSGDMLYTEENIDRTLRALVERVRTAERSRDAVTAMYHGSADRAETAEAERDEARGKLDKVREQAGLWRLLRSADVLAILDGNPA